MDKRLTELLSQAQSLEAQSQFAEFVGADNAAIVRRRAKVVDRLVGITEPYLTTDNVELIADMLSKNSGRPPEQLIPQAVELLRRYQSS